MTLAIFGLPDNVMGMPINDLMLIVGIVFVFVSVALLTVRVNHIDKLQRHSQLKLLNESPTQNGHRMELESSPLGKPSSSLEPNVAVGLAVSNAVNTVMREAHLEQKDAVLAIGHMMRKMYGMLESNGEVSSGEKAESIEARVHRISQKRKVLELESNETRKEERETLGKLSELETTIKNPQMKNIVEVEPPIAAKQVEQTKGKTKNGKRQKSTKVEEFAWEESRVSQSEPSIPVQTGNQEDERPEAKREEENTKPLAPGLQITNGEEKALKKRFKEVDRRVEENHRQMERDGVKG